MSVTAQKKEKNQIGDKSSIKREHWKQAEEFFVEQCLHVKGISRIFWAERMARALAKTKT